MTTYTEEFSGDRHAHDAMDAAQAKANSDNPDVEMICSSVKSDVSRLNEDGTLTYQLTATFVPAPKPTGP